MAIETRDLSFKKGQRVICIKNTRGGRKGLRPPVKLTEGQLYTISKVVKDKWGYIILFVENDIGEIEGYTSYRFDFCRETVLSELLD